MSQVVASRPKIAKHLRVGICLLVFILTSGCAAGLRSEVAGLRRDIGQIRSIQAEHSALLDSVDSQLRQLNGRVEEVEHARNARAGKEVEKLRNQVSSLSRRIPPPQGVPSNLLEEDYGLVSSLPRETASRFERSLDLIRVGRYGDAIPYLQTALDSSAGLSESAFILFWLGVSYERERDFRNSLRAYNEIVTGYPASPRVPSALLRQGEVFRKLKDNTTASITLKKLVKDYPNSPEAARAKKLLK